MARFARGKGRTGRTVTLARHGAVLSKHEVSDPSEMLPGYRRFASAAAARARLAQEAARLLAEQLTPADDEARALAAGLPAPARRAAATFPVRQDVFVSNEATGFMLTSRRMAGKALDEGSTAWTRAVSKGDILPISLFQDDPFVVRVVAGDALEAEEAEEWVARVDGYLDVKDGRLCVTGGAVLVNDEYDPDDSYYDRFVREVPVPKGRYRVSVYTYVPGVNGDAVLDALAGGYQASEPAGAWFRRTRPDAPFPVWLRDRCAGRPETDPGHEADWRGVPLAQDDEWPDYVHFLAHLTPVDTAPAEGLTELPEAGWYGEATNPRTPDRCPAGLEGRDVVGHDDDGAGDWMFVRDPSTRCDGYPLTAVDGGPVDVPIGELHRVFRLAWFASRHTSPVLTLALPGGATVDETDDWPEGAVAVPGTGGGRVVFSSDLQPTEVMGVMAGLAPRLRDLPDGTTLTLDAAAPESVASITPGLDPMAGLQRYRGTLRDGTWSIGETCPALDAATLQGALALAAGVETGTHLDVADDAEGKAIVQWAVANFRYHLEDNPTTVQDAVLRTRETDPAVLALFGVAAFAVRFGAAWPVTDLSRDDDEEDVEDEAPRPVAPPASGEPPRGAEVYAATSGRRYHASAALPWAEGQANRLADWEAQVTAAGFEHVADVVCDQFSRILVRGYARRPGVTWAFLMLAAPAAFFVELSSRFADGASTLTSQNPVHMDEVSAKKYRQGFPDLPLDGLLARHEARLTLLAADHGEPLRTVATDKGMAQAIEAALSR